MAAMRRTLSETALHPQGAGFAPGAGDAERPFGPLPLSPLRSVSVKAHLRYGYDQTMTLRPSRT